MPWGKKTGTKAASAAEEEPSPRPEEVEGQDSDEDKNSEALAAEKLALSGVMAGSSESLSSLDPTAASRNTALAKKEEVAKMTDEAEKALQKAKELEAKTNVQLEAAQKKLAAELAALEKAEAEAAAKQAAVEAALQAEEENKARAKQISEANAAALKAQAALKMKLEKAQAKTAAELEQAQAALEASTQKVKDAEFHRAQTAERLYAVQSSVGDKKEEAAQSQQQAEEERVALVKLQHEKHLLSIQVEELKAEAAALEVELEETDIDEPTGDRLKARFEQRLAEMEKVVEAASVAGSVRDDDAKSTVSETPSAIARKETAAEFRKRQALIGKGVNSKEAEQLATVEAEKSAAKKPDTVVTRTIVRPEDRPYCCGCSALFCGGMWCGIISGAVIGTVASLAATGVTVHAAASTLSSTGSTVGTTVASTWNSTIQPFFVSAGHTVEGWSISAYKASGINSHTLSGI